MATLSIPDKRLTPFYKENPDFDILHCHFSAQTEFSRLNWQGLDQAAILDLLKKYQRLLRVHPDPVVAMILLGASQNQDGAATQPERLQLSLNEGAASASQDAPDSAQPGELDSAQAIAAIPREQFVQQFGAAVGGAAVAAQIHQNATSITAKTMHLWANVHNLVASPHFRAMRVNNTGKDLYQFEDFPDYQELFGSLDFCECNECHSIFGPAAYLVDLMRITDQYITIPNAGTIGQHLTLNERRPDLANIELTCENTNDLVPSLDIVNTILEIRMAHFLRADAGSPYDAAYSSLATATYPFNLPFNLPLEQIRSYLEQLNTDLATLYQTFHAPQEAIARETLGLSLEEFTLITTPRPNADDLSLAYGVPVSVDLGGLAQQEIFLKQTGLSRQELQDLLTQNLSNSELSSGSIPHSFYVNQVLASGQYLRLATDGSDTISNLNLATLDRLHRFIRLARKLNWSFADLDWVLRSLQASEITSTAIQSIAKIKQAQTKLTLPLPVLCSFWYDIKTIGVGDSGASQALFDTIFNNPHLLGDKQPYHPRYQDKYSLFINPLYTDPVLTVPGENSRVAAGLRMSLDDLTILITTGDPDQSDQMDLTVQNLSLFYRHALLATLVQLPIDQYISLLRLAHKLKLLLTIDDLLYLLDIVDWLRSSGFTVSELEYILHGKTSTSVASKYPEAEIPAFLQSLQALGISAPPALAVDDIMDWPGLVQKLNNHAQPGPSQRLWNLLATDTQRTIEQAATSTTDLTSQQKSELTNALNAILQRPDFYEKADFGSLALPEQVTSLLQAGKILSENEIQKLNRLLLEVAYPREIAKSSIRQIDDEWKEKLIQQLAIFVNSTTDRVEALMEVIATRLTIALPHGLHSYIEAFLNQPPATPGPNYVQQALEMLSRWLVLTEKLQLTSAEIDSLRTYPVCYGFPTYFGQLTLENLKTLSTFKRLALAFQDTQNSLIKYLASTQTPPQPETKAPTLTEITGWSKQQIQEAVNTYFQQKPSLLTSIDGLTELKKAFDLSKSMGVNISFYQHLLPLATASAKDNWVAHTNAVDLVISAVKAKYNDNDWSKVSEKINGTLNETKRSALAGFVMEKLGLKNLRALTEYLLIDVEMTGCVSISLIKQAILSIQMYLQRCRMNLEPGVLNVAIHDTWWEWIMNYRIWQANRKVFLYPENYLDPGLRKSKSELFQELQSELLQSDITQESVEAAYQKYFDTFAELAKLRIVASYRCFVTPSSGDEAVDTLFLFGRTTTEPPTYYYRTYLNPTASPYLNPDAGHPAWTPWSKIDLNINSEYISPVFAFHKLFVFWVETQQTTSSSSMSEPKTTIKKATIKYTFQTLSGKWVQPQTLAKDMVIEVTPNNYQPYAATDNPADLDLHTDKLFWEKVYALVLPGQGTEAEQVLVIFGDMPAVSATPPQPPSSATKDTDILQFDQQIYAAQRQGYLAEQAGFQGYNSLVPAMTFHSDASTESTFLLFPRTEGGAQSAKSGTFAAIIGTVDGTIFTAKAVDNVLHANYMADAKRSLAGHLTGYWPLDEGSGSTVYNKEGDADGTIEGSANWSTVTDFPGASRRSVLQFGQPGTYVALPPADLPIGSAITISFWTFGLSLPMDGNSILEALDENGKGILLISFLKEEASISFACGGDSIHQIPDTHEYHQKWAHWAFTKDATLGEMKIYLNGRLLLCRNGLTALFPIAKKLTLGQAYVGSIAEVCIWNVALDLAQIVAVMREARPLMKNLSRQNASVQTVKNQPDWSILDNGDEAFLVISDLDILKPISDGLTVQSAGRNALKLSYTDTYSDFPPDFQFIFTRLTTTTIRQLSQKVFTGGIDRLLTLDSQEISEPDFARFQPAEEVIPPTKNALDFSGPYGLYFQEIFFSIPFLIASTLTANQRFAEAQKWYHYIFNPTQTRGSTASEQSFDRFWRYLPFRGNTMQKLEDILQDGQAIQVYNDDPFDPDAIARLRIGAYQKAVVMKYIDNLLDWGDSLFAQDTWESITQATMLYLLAYDLLGARPANMGQCQAPAPQTFAEIKAHYAQKPIPQFLLELEQRVVNNHPSSMVSPPFNAIHAYFCVSENDQFTAYWDRVEDRLYKIRHCENIEGAVRQLALFEPPLNPADLVRAAAAGNVPLNVVTGLAAEVPHYRFDFLLERAKNISSTLIELGAALLSALEKKDGEQLAFLRATQEAALLQLIKTTKLKHIDEANKTREALSQSLTAAQHRVDFYQRLINGGLSTHEQDSQRLLGDAIIPQELALALNAIGAPLFAIPDIFGMADGGQQLGMIFTTLAGVSEGNAALLNQSASLATTMAQYDRRSQEWQLQYQMALDETTLLGKQIEATQITITIAQSELDAHQKNIEQANEIEDFLKRRFSNQDLYQWMLSRLSVLYFQTFKLALEMALSVQKAYQFELNRDDTYIGFDYWDSLKQGLLAGEGLLFGLNQLEKAYIEGNSRRLEIEKTISLRQLNPRGFLDLKNTGKCQFELSEKLFDSDFPGHYCRQIKTIALSIPAIVGPYQNINATLTQLSDRVLVQADPQAVSYLWRGEQPAPDPLTLRRSWRRNQKIALSRGVNDTGMFELNFRDERYLPFEGTGALSTWELSMPKTTNRIDFESLSDVLIHLSYTALDAGDGQFTRQVKEEMQRNL